MPTFRWHAIVTTNYDFLIERAYQDHPSKLQTPLRISENGDADRADLGSQLNVPLLKLHGCLSAITDDSPPLILSTEEYARHREKRERVFGLFADWATTHPIVFCGYKIGDPNIQQILFDLGDRSINRPQYAVIDPSLNEFDVRYWQSRRFIPQKLTFKKFLEDLDTHISRNARKLAVLRSPHTSSINSRTMRGSPSSELLLYIENEFNHVHEGMSTSAVDPRDFYRGSGDSWYAIASGLDVERRFVDEFLLTAVLGGVPPKLIIFNGVLGGARAPHCQERRLQRDRFATTMTILNRSDCFGAARAGSEWPARHAHSSACPNA